MLDLWTAILCLYSLFPLVSSLYYNLLLSTSFPSFAVRSRTRWAVVLGAKAVPNSPCTPNLAAACPRGVARARREAVEVFRGTGALVLPRVPFPSVCLCHDISKSKGMGSLTPFSSLSSCFDPHCPHSCSNSFCTHFIGQKIIGLNLD